MAKVETRKYLLCQELVTKNLFSMVVTTELEEAKGMAGRRFSAAAAAMRNAAFIYAAATHGFQSLDALAQIETPSARNSWTSLDPTKRGLINK